MNIRTEPLPAESGNVIACLIIKTGRPGYYAHFYPALYQLILVTEATEEKVDLGYSGSRLLERLLQTPGEVVSREELMNQAWADRVVGQGSLNQQIYTLRQVLSDEKSREIIQTLPRRGYLFNPSYLACSSCVDDGSEAVAPAAPQMPAPSEPPLRRNERQRTLWITLLAVIALILCGQFGYLYQLSQTPQLHSSEMTLGKLKVRYLDQDSRRLQPLILQTHALISRLSALTRQPASLTVTLQGDFYKLLCERTDGSMRSLMFHENQMGKLANAQLSRCLQ